MCELSSVQRPLDRFENRHLFHVETWVHRQHYRSDEAGVAGWHADAGTPVVTMGGGKVRADVRSRCTQQII